MKSIVTVLGMVVFVTVMVGCSTGHRSSTTTTETVETVPANPALGKKQTTVNTETRTSE